MSSKKNETTKPSEPDKVDTYLQNLNHPLKDVIEVLRQIILNADSDIGEEIKWNAPTFFYTGEMQPFNPKEYKRHIIVFNLFKQDCIRLVFPSGEKVNDSSGLLEGDYADGRRLAIFYSVADVQTKEMNLKNVIKKWLELLEK